MATSSDAIRVMIDQLWREICVVAVTAGALVRGGACTPALALSDEIVRTIKSQKRLFHQLSAIRTLRRSLPFVFAKTGKVYWQTIPSRQGNNPIAE